MEVLSSGKKYFADLLQRFLEDPTVEDNEFHVVKFSILLEPKFKFYQDKGTTVETVEEIYVRCVRDNNPFSLSKDKDSLLQDVNELYVTDSFRERLEELGVKGEFSAMFVYATYFNMNQKQPLAKDDGGYRKQHPNGRTEGGSRTEKEYTDADLHGFSERKNFEFFPGAPEVLKIEGESYRWSSETQNLCEFTVTRKDGDAADAS